MISSLTRSVKTFFATITLGLIPAVAHPALAQTGAEEAVFVDLGRWTIVELPRARYCELRLASGDLVFSKADRQPARLRLLAGRSVGAPQGEIVWAFDDSQFAGQQYNRGIYGPSSDTSAVEEQFRKAKFLTVRQGDQTLARISLKTSSAGFRLLKQCAEQWRYAPRVAERAPAAPVTRAAAAPAARPYTPPPSTPPPTRPAARTEVAEINGPYPPNRALKPLNPGQWVRQDDFRRFNQSRFGSGSLRFTLEVNAEGRVDECIVNASSGSRDFDETTCEALEKRARFEPATDSSGNATRASYSSRVRFAIGD